MHKKYNDGQINQGFEDAWSGYRESFDDDAAEVLAKISTAFVDYIPYAKEMDVESVMRIMRELGRHEEASRLLKLFMDRRQEERSFYDLDDLAFASEVKDEELKAAFRVKYESMYQAREPAAILLKIYRNEG